MVTKKEKIECAVCGAGMKLPKTPKLKYPKMRKKLRDKIAAGVALSERERAFIEKMRPFDDERKRIAMARLFALMYPDG